MNVVAGLQSRSTGLRHDQVVPLRNTDVDRILPIGITRIPLTQERMTGQRPGHRFIHEGMQQTEHHRIADIGPQQSAYRDHHGSALLKICDTSGLSANRWAIGSALKFSPLPVVCVPPFRNGIGVI